MLETIQGAKFNITTRTVETNEMDVNETLKSYGVSAIEIPYLRDYKNMQRDENGKMFAPQVNTQEGKPILKEISNGFCGSVAIKMKHVLIELSLMHNSTKNDKSQLESDFRIIQPWDVVTNDNGTKRFYPLRSFNMDFRSSADDLVGIGNTYAKTDKSGNPGKPYASCFIPNKLLAAIKVYVDKLCLEADYQSLNAHQHNSETNVDNISDGESRAQV